MSQIKRVIIVVLDSLGVGALPDAADYGDAGANTLGNLARAHGGLHLPNLGRLGLGNLTEVRGVPPVGGRAQAAYGRLMTASQGKETLTGHWELVGIKQERPFRAYPEGFPPEVIEAFIEQTGIPGVLGNRPASGTEILKQLGEAHLATKRPIVYTSADSVFQVACHEAIYPPPELYRLCTIARQIMTGEHTVGRIIARPFTGDSAANFTRTDRRKDFPLVPPVEHLLDAIVAKGLEVVAIGKIEDIFAGRGITRAIHTHNNRHGLEVTLEQLGQSGPGLIFTNLVDGDSLYGHRNDVKGYAQALEEIDQFVPKLEGALQATDVLLFVADHGCDPTTPSTDHDREYVPLLVRGAAIKAGVDLGVRRSIGDVGATVAAWLDCPFSGHGESFSHLIS